MRQMRSKVVLVPLLSVLCALLFTLTGCSSRGGKAGPEAPTQDMTQEEAQSIFEAERGRAGMPEPGEREPQSVAEVLEIMRRDDSVRFPQGRDFLAKLPEGVDVLIARATLETLWAEGLLTVEASAHERFKRQQAQLEAIKAEQRAKPEDEALKKRLSDAEAELTREERLGKAVRVLAKPHHNVGESLAQEVKRRNPERPESYAILANLYRLHRDWNEFESNMQKAQSRSTERVGVLYARAMERAARLGDRPGARQELATLLTEHPDFTRAQAQLVLLEDDVEPRYEQLQKLKALNPRHALILLEGPAIESEYETTKALRAAQAPAAP